MMETETEMGLMMMVEGEMLRGTERMRRRCVTAASCWVW